MRGKVDKVRDRRLTRLNMYCACIQVVFLDVQCSLGIILLLNVHITYCSCFC